MEKQLGEFSRYVLNAGSRLLAHTTVFLLFITVGELIQHLTRFVVQDSRPLSIAMRVVEYAFIAVGILFILIFLFREVVTLVRSSFRD